MCSGGEDEGTASGSTSRQDPSESPSADGGDEEDAYAGNIADVVGLEEDAEAEEDDDGEEDELAVSDTPSDDAAEASLKVKPTRGAPAPKKQFSRAKPKKQSPAPTVVKGKKRAAGTHSTYQRNAFPRD